MPIPVYLQFMRFCMGERTLMMKLKYDVITAVGVWIYFCCLTLVWNVVLPPNLPPTVQVVLGLGGAVALVMLWVLVFCRGG